MLRWTLLPSAFVLATVLSSPVQAQLSGSVPTYGSPPVQGYTVPAPQTPPSYDGATVYQVPQTGAAPQIYPTTPTYPNTAAPNFTGPTYQQPVLQPTVREADLIIEGYPARTGRVTFGGAVNSDAGVTGQITIDERNFDITRWPRSFQDLLSGTAFRGAGQTLRLEAVPGNLFQRYTAQFADPNLFGYLPISMSVSGFLFDRRYEDWDEQRLGGRLSLGYRVTPDLSVSAGITGQAVELTRPSGSASIQPVAPATDPVSVLTPFLGDSSIFSGLVSLIHDTRNNPMMPSEGHFMQLSYEQTFGDFDYPKFEFEYRKYFQVAQRADGSGKQTLAYTLQLGYSGDETPIYENYFAGGYATLRGFDFRGASPVDPNYTFIETGGRFQWLNSVEYLFPITADDAFQGALFVDFGTVESDFEIDADDFRVAPGFGLRVAIPMLGPAPLAFDFAFPVSKSEFDDERVFNFYMSANRF
ncbi:MAG: BamA/TamA family outer membrane protein [Planctomycetota bacterium]